MKDIDALIEKLEELTGPDREVSRGIALALRTFDETENGINYAHYTASLDAALTLVPEEMWIDNTCINTSTGSHFEIHDNHIYDERGKGDHKISAIALCIAALKALRSRTESPGNG